MLDWAPDVLESLVRRGVRRFHVLTNIRAYDAPRAFDITRSAAAAVRVAFDEPRFALRGDSTLRGYVHEEYSALRSVVFPEANPVLMLVPALPSAGRVTIDGVHYLERDAVRTPLHETEYAREGAFAYPDANLLAWAEHRSGGHFDHRNGALLGLDSLRRDGPRVVRDSLVSLSRLGRPAVCVPDAETMSDLMLIADGLAQAEEAGARVITRCAPAFASILTSSLAHGALQPPRATGGLLVVCGSHVQNTTRQLEYLQRVRQVPIIEAGLRELVENTANGVSSIADRALKQLRTNGLAVVATPREDMSDDGGVDLGQRLALALAGVVKAVGSIADVVLLKGGITGATCVRHGLGARLAKVLGPIGDGVSLWEASTPNGHPKQCLIFPGNTGDERALARIVEAVAP